MMAAPFSVGPHQPGHRQNLKLAYAVSLGAAPAMNTPRQLRSRKTLHLHHRFLGRALQNRRHVGHGRRIVWRHGPQATEAEPQSRCRPLGNLVVTTASGPPRVIATDKETGKIVWESSFADTPDVELSSAPLAVKDKIILGAANGDAGVRD